MKVIVAGSRDFQDYNLLSKTLMHLLSNLNLNDLEIVSGGARGADRLGEQFAWANELKFAKFPADWDTYGKRAGILRNEMMAAYADCLVAFWDGKSRGTKHMIETARANGLRVRVVRYDSTQN